MKSLAPIAQFETAFDGVEDRQDASTRRKAMQFLRFQDRQECQVPMQKFDEFVVCCSGLVLGLDLSPEPMRRLMQCHEVEGGQFLEDSMEQILRDTLKMPVTVPGVANRVPWWIAKRPRWS